MFEVFLFVLIFVTSCWLISKPKKLAHPEQTPMNNQMQASMTLNGEEIDEDSITSNRSVDDKETKKFEDEGSTFSISDPTKLILDDKALEEGAAYAAGGAVIGAEAATVGGMGLAVGGTTVEIGLAPVVAADTVAGIALSGAKTAIEEGDATPYREEMDEDSKKFEDKGSAPPLNDKALGEGAAYAAGGAVIGAGVAATVGGMGLAVGGTAVGIGLAPVVAAGTVAGIALSGAKTAIEEGDATALSAVAGGAALGAGISTVVGGMGLAVGGTAVAIGIAPVAAVGAVVGLAGYGLWKLLSREKS